MFTALLTGFAVCSFPFVWTGLVSVVLVWADTKSDPDKHKHYDSLREWWNS